MTPGISLVNPRNGIIIQSTILLLVLTFLAGCTLPYRNPLVEPPTMVFSGIDPTLSDSGAVSMIMIHGMCHHDVAWFQNSKNRIADALAVNAGSISQIPLNNPAGITAYKADVVRGIDKLRIYGILYSQATLQLKRDNLCRDVSDDNDVCEKPYHYKPKRASLNETLKNNLMNNCLADAVAYLGPSGEGIRRGVSEALDAIFKDNEKDHRLAVGPVMFLSESLGSKVLGDALICSTPEMASRVYTNLGRTSHLFLWANQIPLLNLGFRGPGCPTPMRELESKFGMLDLQEGGLRGLIEIIKSSQSKRLEGISQPTLVVAFTDPNDLLSYEVAPEDFGGLSVVNVIVSNSSSLFGYVENPDTAHRGYSKNDAVLDILRCGSRKPLSKGCADQ